MSPGDSRAQAARALVARTTAAQGAPEHVEDAGVLARVAGILLATGNGNAGPSKAGATTVTTPTRSGKRGGRRAHQPT